MSTFENFWDNPQNEIDFYNWLEPLVANELRGMGLPVRDVSDGALEPFPYRQTNTTPNFIKDSPLMSLIEQSDTESPMDTDPTPLPYDHTHLPEVAVSHTELHPFLRPIVEVGGGDFRSVRIGGMEDPVVILAHNRLYPLALYLAYDHECRMYHPAVMQADGTLYGIATMQSAAIWLPGLASAYAQALKHYHPTRQPLPAA